MEADFKEPLGCPSGNFKGNSVTWGPFQLQQVFLLLTLLLSLLCHCLLSSFIYNILLSLTSSNTEIGVLQLICLSLNLPLSFTNLSLALINM